MIESLHHMVDELRGILLTLLGQVEIEHGSFEAGVTEIALDDAQVDAGFQEMGGVGVAQGVDGHALFAYCGSALGVAEGVLDAAFGDGLGGLLGSGFVVAASGKDKAGMFVSTPVAAQQSKGRLGQRDVAVLGAFATVDMNHHALAVDIGDFEMAGFAEA